MGVYGIVTDMKGRGEYLLELFSLAASTLPNNSQTSSLGKVNLLQMPCTITQFFLLPKHLRKADRQLKEGLVILTRK